MLFLLASKTFAVRFFITDDVRVVEWWLCQYESWLRFDKHAYQHWNMIAYGPSKRWELAIGFVLGIEAPQKEHTQHSYAIPLLSSQIFDKRVQVE